MAFGDTLRKPAFVAILGLGLLTSCIHKKYETPITKDTQQPDKVLFDKAVKDIERGRYEVARISLNTLMNTYESSEYMAKAKLAIADSWYREAGSSGMAQAEAEYKDFILFYPQMEESAEAQNRICEIHYRQMDKSDRDWSQALRAETECRQLLVQFPNSKFAPIAAQRLRNIQESLAEHEFVVGNFYWKRQMMPAAANRLTSLVDQYPLYSQAGESLFEAGDAYSKMGPRFRKQAGEEFAKVVQDYPGSPRMEEATKRLEDMELPVPKPTQAALDRAKFEHESYKKPGMMSRSTGFLSSHPDLSHAAKAGAPTMTDPKRTIPASVPIPAQTAENGEIGATGNTDVTATQVGANSALDKAPDARTAEGTPATDTNNAATAATTTPAQQQPLPTNRDADLKKMREKQAKQQAKMDKKKKKDQGQTTPDKPAAANGSAAQPQGQPSPPPQPQQ
jgi:outer membrane protein assembly factor BamD